MGWLCNFLPHRWRHVTNADNSQDPLHGGSVFGLYQCARCRRLSIGSPR